MKRILKWVMWLGILCALGIGALLGISKVSALDKDYIAFRANLDELAGVKIGESQEEILYSLGAPQSVRMADFNSKDSKKPENRDEFPNIGLPNGKKVEDYPIWQWHNNGLYLTAYFHSESKKIWRLSCMYVGNDNDGPRCRTVGGIDLGAEDSILGRSSYRRTEGYILDYLGKPDKEVYSTVGETHRKILTYNELGLEFILIGREAVNIYKIETNPSFMWWLQHGPKQPVY